jgi:hypothetical protein
VERVLANVTDHRLAPYGPQSAGGLSRRFSPMYADQTAFIGENLRLILDTYER